MPNTIIEEVKNNKITKKISNLNISSKIIIIFLVVLILFLTIFNNIPRRDYRITQNDTTQNINGKYYPVGYDYISLNSTGMTYFFSNNTPRYDYTFDLDNPKIVINNNIFAIYDHLGSQVYLFDTNGYLNDFKVEGFIDSLDVASNGSVALISKISGEYKIYSYDRDSNINTKISMSYSEYGYPMSVCFNSDASRIYASYLNKNDGVVSKIVCFDIIDEDNNIIFEKEYSDNIFPSIKHLNNDKIIAFGMDKIIFINDKDEPEIKKSTKINGEIKSIATLENKAVVITNIKNNKHVLNIINSNGSISKKKSFEKNYVDMQVSGNKILLYSNNQMLIFSKRGKKIYDGKIKDIPIKILKSKGYNKYKIITNDSILEIRLKLW